jgi:hypothetical protein
MATRTRNAASFAAEAEFLARLKELGATLLEPEWLGARTPHRMLCAAGHECGPRPSGLKHGQGICLTCAGKDSRVAEAAFRARLDDLGATLLEPEYLSANAWHRIRCAAGHEARTMPSILRRGHGPCRVCARQDPETTYAAFRERLAEIGATLVEAEWLGNNRGHRVVCPAGHECRARPAALQQGRGMCAICAQNSPAAAEAAFRARLAELGAEMLGEYRGNKAKTHVRCAAGHDCYPKPNGVSRGLGPCITCAGRDPVAAEAAFLARLAALGAVPLYSEWLGGQRNHHVRCACGNECWPRPGDVRAGDGICAKCARMFYTVFYVLEHESKPLVKFGISSNEGRRRLSNHRRDGFTVVHLLMTGLADGVPRTAEKAVMSALALAGEKPHRGREYFNASCLALILDVAVGWLGIDRELPVGALVAA